MSSTLDYHTPCLRLRPKILTARHRCRQQPVDSSEGRQDQQHVMGSQHLRPQEQSSQWSWNGRILAATPVCPQRPDAWDVGCPAETAAEDTLKTCYRSFQRRAYLTLYVCQAGIMHMGTR